MPLSGSVPLQWSSAVVAAAPQILTCVYCVLAKWEHANLSAPYWRWYCNDAPGAFLVMKNKRIPIEPGRVMLIPPHTDYDTDWNAPFGHLHIHFALGLNRTVTPGRIFHHTPTDVELAMIERLKRVLGAHPEASPLTASFLAQALINPALAAMPADYWDGRVPDPRVARAMERLRERGAAVGNAELAREAGMNANAFIRKFRQAVGHTPHQYLLRLRVERACEWMRRRELTMDQIAEAAGFCDRFHFSRVFKQVMGVSPAKFREGMKAVAD